MSLGRRGALILKADSEPALKDLRVAVAEELAKSAGECQIIQENGLPYESQTNGSIEHAVNLFRGYFRILTSSLEAQIQGVLLVTQPVLTWLVEHTASTFNTHIIGHGGQTLFERW